MNQNIISAMNKTNKKKKSRWETTQSPFLLKSIYNGWNKEKAAHSYSTRTVTYTKVGLGDTTKVQLFHIKVTV